MKTLFRWLIVLMMLVLTFEISAQSLALIKKNKVLIRFTKGDNILYSVRPSGKLVAGKILTITPDHFVTDSDTVQLSDIKRLDIRDSQHRNALRSSGIKLIVAGVLLGLGDFLNVTVVQDQPYSYQSGVTLTSAALMLTGFSLYRLSNRKMKLRRNVVLMSID